MTCVMMGKYYIQIGVNVKNGIFQLTSASIGICVRNKYPADGSNIRPMYILQMCGVASNCLQEGASYPGGRHAPGYPMSVMHMGIH